MYSCNHPGKKWLNLFVLPVAVHDFAVAVLEEPKDAGGVPLTEDGAVLQRRRELKGCGVRGVRVLAVDACALAVAVGPGN